MHGTAKEIASHTNIYIPLLRYAQNDEGGSLLPLVREQPEIWVSTAGEVWGSILNVIQSLIMKPIMSLEIINEVG